MQKDTVNPQSFFDVGIDGIENTLDQGEGDGHLP